MTTCRIWKPAIGALLVSAALAASVACATAAPARARVYVRVGPPILSRPGTHPAR